MILRLVLMLIVTGSVLGGIGAWKYQQMQAAAERMAQPPPPAVVAAAQVTRESWQPTLDAVGSLVAVNDAFVTNEIAGKVAAVLFESGDRVEDGQVLVRLDDSTDRAELAGLEAELRLAELQFERSERLLADRTLSRSDYDEARARLESAQANVAAKRALIDKKRIPAPFAGQLGIRLVNIGEYLAPGAHIVPLQSLDPIFVDYSLPERHLAAVSVGQAVEVAVQAYPGEHFRGRISAINPGVDPGTRSMRLRGTLDNPGGRLRPGMFAETRTLLPLRDDVLTLPQNAITFAPYGDSVFVVRERDAKLIVERRQVRTGAVRDGRVEIVGGLEPGDRVVSAGQNKLRNGQQVRIDESVAPKARIDKP